MEINKLITNTNRTLANGRDISYIVIHFIGAFGTAKQNASYFKDLYRGASAHYFVDPKEIWQVVEDKDVAWHCGGKGSGPYKGVCTNKNSIGIELAVTKMNRDSRNAKDNDWYFDDKTVEKAKELTLYLMDKYGLSEDRVIRHHDVTNKLCPRPFVGDDINKYYNKTGNYMWDMFKKELKEGGLSMDGKEIYEKLTAYMNTIPTSSYAEESSKKAIKSGIFKDGTGDEQVDYPRSFMTREQLAVVLNRANLLE